MSHKRITFSITGLCLASALIFVNAVYWQNGRHPAPIGIAGLRQLKTAMDPTSDMDHTASLTRRQIPSPDKSVVAGKTGKLISDIQRELKRAGLYDGDIDGIQGPVTRSAIIAYQRRAKIKSTGLPTGELLRQLRFSRMLASPVSARQSQSGAGPARAVKLIQTGLAELGYTPGPIDGALGEETRQAIREFERDRGLKITGTVSVRLIKEMRKVTGVSVLNST